jgi:hypothetical protein
MPRAHWGTILSVDDSVGRLYRLLEQAGELDETLIVFTSDNGLLNGEHGMIDNPRFARKVAELDAHLQRLLKETGADPDEMPIDEGVKKELPDAKIR